MVIEEGMLDQMIDYMKKLINNALFAKKIKLSHFYFVS